MSKKNTLKNLEGNGVAQAAADAAAKKSVKEKIFGRFGDAIANVLFGTNKEDVARGKRNAAELNKRYRFIEALNKENVGEALKPTFSKMLGLPAEVVVKHLSCVGRSGVFHNVIFDENGKAINPVAVYKVWVTPGNEKHSGIWTVEHEGDFIQLSVKSGEIADVRTAVLDSTGKVLTTTVEGSAKLVKMVGYVNGDFMVKADVEKDLGGDYGLFTAIRAMESNPETQGKRADLILIVQGKGGMYQDKKGFLNQRAGAAVLLHMSNVLRMASRQPKNPGAATEMFSATMKPRVRHNGVALKPATFETETTKVPKLVSEMLEEASAESFMKHID